MEQKSKNNSKKAALIVTVVILVGALLVAGCLLLTAKSRIVGVWLGGPLYLDYHSSDCYMVLSFEKNGDYSMVLTDVRGNILKTETGVWKASNFHITALVVGEFGSIGWDYNPITDEITNGLWTLKGAGE